MSAPSVSIIIPARNEKPFIQKIIERLPAFPAKYEVIFVEGHSEDGTLEEIKRIADNGHYDFPIRYLVQKGRGKADAVWLGFGEAQNDILMILDADMTVAPEELLGFYNSIISDRAAFLNGSRLTYKMEKGAMRPLNYLGNKMFALLFWVISGQKVTDTLCGTKALWRSDFEKMKNTPWLWRLDDPFCDFTLLFGAMSLGLKIKEIPVHYKRRIHGRTKIRRFRDGWKLLRIVFRARAHLS